MDLAKLGGSEGQRHGDWIQTYSLRRFWPLDPRVEDVCIEDIAHALSMQCRFSGHVHSFYSVAEHCVRVSMRAVEIVTEAGLSDAVALDVARWGLLHDAAEAYLVDLARPVKRSPEMTPYRLAEARLHGVICERFGLRALEPAEVKQADNDLLYTEARDLFPGVHPEWHWHAQPLPGRIQPWTHHEAKAAFLARFRVFFGGES